MLQHTNPVEKKTAKGVEHRVKDAHLHFEYYLDALKNFYTLSTEPYQVYPYCVHTVCTVQMCNVGMSVSGIVTGWMCDNTIHTHAHGHWSTLL